MANFYQRGITHVVLYLCLIIALPKRLQQMKQNTKKVFRSLTLCVYALLTLTPPLPTPHFFLILPLHVEKKRASFLSALVQDTFACQMLCPQSTCNLIARRTTIIEDKDADCGVMDGLLHQDLNCQ